MSTQKIFDGLRYEPHIPHGSGDAEYRLVNKAGRVLAVIDPDMVFDDAAGVAEALVRAVRYSDDMLAALRSAQRALAIVEDHGTLSGGQMAKKHKMNPFEGYNFVLKNSRPAAQAVAAAIGKAEGQSNG